LWCPRSRRHGRAVPRGPGRPVDGTGPALRPRGPHPGVLMATVDPTFAELLPPWLATQRWYTGKGRTPRLERVGGLRLQDPAREVGIEVWLLRDTAGPVPVLYQVPLTYRGAPLPDLEPALVGTTIHSELGPRWVYDG